jgi:hypothetical protein
MNYKCPFCQRTFSRHSSYTRYVSKCILTVDSSNESNEDSNEPKFSINTEELNNLQSAPEVFKDNILFGYFILYINV